VDVREGCAPRTKNPQQFQGLGNRDVRNEDTFSKAILMSSDSGHLASVGVEKMRVLMRAGWQREPAVSDRESPSVITDR
jgi:hypothetical protein